MATQENVKTADGGVLYLAPIGTAAPTSAVSVLGAGWKDLGYWANAGATITPVPGDSTTVEAHNGDVVIRKTKKGNVTLQFPFIELNVDVFEIYWDTEVDPEDGSYAIEGGAANREYQLVYDTLYSDETIDRKYAPLVGLETRSAVANAETTPVTHDITFGTRNATGQANQILGWNTGFVVDEG